MSNRTGYEHILGFALEHPWALTKSMCSIVASILARHIAGHETSSTELSALTNRSKLPQPKRGGAVAVIPMYGVIAPRVNMLSDISGGTTFETLTAQLHAALRDDEVKTILFDVDSPGGNVAGATEFAQEILKARAQKPIIAQAQFLMASAAYWAMAGATQIVASPSAMVGSIGVYAIHDDITEALAKEGIKREVISAGKFKAEGIGGGALSDEARAYAKTIIESAYSNFTRDVANGRGVKPADVRNGFGEGRVVAASDALALGLVDRVATLHDTIKRVASPEGVHALTNPSALATDQEPSPATSQELAADVAWQNGVTAALLTW